MLVNNTFINTSKCVIDNCDVLNFYTLHHINTSVYPSNQVFLNKYNYIFVTNTSIFVLIPIVISIMILVMIILWETSMVHIFIGISKIYWNHFHCNILLIQFSDIFDDPLIRSINHQIQKLYYTRFFITDMGIFNNIKNIDFGYNDDIEIIIDNFEYNNNFVNNDTIEQLYDTIGIKISDNNI